MRDPTSPPGSRAPPRQGPASPYLEHLATLGIAPESLRVDSGGTLIGEASEAGDAALEPLAGLDLGDPLGEGGMGLVRVARQRSLEREVAIKQLKPHALTGQYQALVREARITGGLEHPNIVPVHELGLASDGSPMFAMKRVSGSPWSAWLADATPAQVERMAARGGPLAFHLDVLVQVCHAVAFAHSRGTLHRDLKPANVMIGDFGEVYVVDWGVALRLGEPRRSEEIAGTPAYMAPEMAAGGALDVRADVYQLGAILFELVTGIPFRGGADILEVLATAWTGRVPDLPADVPAPLRDIVLRAVAFDREARFATVGELQRAVQDFLRQRALLDLAEVARGRAREVERRLASGATASDLRQLVAEARFGFDQVLGQEALPEVAEDRRRLLVALLDSEIAARRPEMAEQLLADLGEQATPAQREAVRRLVDAGRAAERELRRLRAQENMAIGGAARRRAQQVAAAASVTAYTLAFGLEWTRGTPLRHAEILPAVLLPTVVLITGFARLGLVAPDTRARQSHYAAFVLASVVVLAFALTWAVGMDVRSTAAILAIAVVSGGLLQQAILSNLRLAAGAAAYAATGLAILALPHPWFWLASAAGTGFAHLSLAWAEPPDPDDSAEIG